MWQEPRDSNINIEAYTISELPCAISDTRVWSNSSRVMANIRQVMERHREGQGEGPLTQKIIARAINEGIIKEISERESDAAALAADRRREAGGGLPCFCCLGAPLDRVETQRVRRWRAQSHYSREWQLWSIPTEGCEDAEAHCQVAVGKGPGGPRSKEEREQRSWFQAVERQLGRGADPEARAWRRQETTSWWPLTVGSA